MSCGTTSSVQMLMLGIFGEYVGRLFVETRRRPLFIIREVVRAPGEVTAWPMEDFLPENPALAARR